MGSLNLPRAGTVYADTQILVYSVERHPRYIHLLAPLWELASRGELRICSSDLALMEVLVLPIRNRNAALQRDYRYALLDSNLVLLSITRTVLREAARLRAEMPRLRTPDAIHAATALCHDCALFLTNDHGLRETPGLAVAVLDDALAS